MRNVDEVARKPARYDPRREESEPPPPSEELARPGAPEGATVPPSEEAINLRELAVPSEPPAPAAPAAPPARFALGEHATATPADVEIAEAPPPSALEHDLERPRAAAAPAAHAFTNVDPRLETIEPAIAAGDWAAIVRLLGSDEEAGRLPPNLGLLYALARKEAEHDDATAKHGSELTQLAIRCMAGLFGVPAQSPIALVLAKRLLRKNPVSWQKRPAPPAKVSVLFIVLAIAIGSAVGWAISQGYVRFHWH
jgi:hypothetical protein